MTKWEAEFKVPGKGKPEIPGNTWNSLIIPFSDFTQKNKDSDWEFSGKAFDLMMSKIPYLESNQEIDFYVPKYTFDHINEMEGDNYKQIFKDVKAHMDKRCRKKMIKDKMIKKELLIVFMAFCVQGYFLMGVPSQEERLKMRK